MSLNRCALGTMPNIKISTVAGLLCQSNSASRQQRLQEQGTICPVSTSIFLVDPVNSQDDGITS